jgi:hypothetical protein
VSEDIKVALLLCVVFVFGVCVGVYLDKEAEAVRIEAVERGFAEWVPDKEGNTTFKWKEVAK